jgi:hypothetical protein
MHAATVGFDVVGLARYELKKVESSNHWAEGMTKAFGVLVGISHKKLVDFLGFTAGSALVKLIQREIRRTREFTHVFRGLREDLREAISGTGVYPNQNLIQRADDMQRELERVKQATRDACIALRKINSASRVASVFERFESELTGLQGAIYRFRLVAIGADGIAERSWEEEVAIGRAAFHEAAAKIDDLSTDDLDLELMAMALAAVQSSDKERATALH